MEVKDGHCDFLCVHQDTVDQVCRDMPDDEVLYDLAELFKVFGDTTRIKILYALFESEMCVCDIAQLLGVTQTAVSHQLRVLKTNKLVKFRNNCRVFAGMLCLNFCKHIIHAIIMKIKSIAVYFSRLGNCLYRNFFIRHLADHLLKTSLNCFLCADNAGVDFLFSHFLLILISLVILYLLHYLIKHFLRINRWVSIIKEAEFNV